MMRVLYTASEAYPLIKTGGLADVASGLPSALKDLGIDIRILLPAYPEALEKADAIGKSIRLDDVLGYKPVRLIPARMPDTGVEVMLLDCHHLYDRSGGPYQSNHGTIWPDNHLRFALLSKVAADICIHGTPDGWKPDLLHANDWQTGLAPVHLKNHDTPTIPSVFTIHNIHYQGLFDPGNLLHLGLRQDNYTIDGVEFYHQISFMKAGLQYADRITTVSPTYALEIQSEKMGEGLEGVLESRNGALRGILNGVDYTLWNPETDPDLVQNYGPDNLALKVKNKRYLQKSLGLEQNDKTMLIGVTSRFASQKGIDLILQTISRIIEQGAQIIVLGSGEAEYENAIINAAASYPRQVSVTIGYDEALAHRIQAGADTFLMPSYFEPCGLTQLYALKYATLPIVHRTGGLADTVVDIVVDAAGAISNDGHGTGFVFAEATPEGLLGAISRAHQLYHRPDGWRIAQLNAMKQDFSWKKSAQEYKILYEELAGYHR